MTKEELERTHPLYEARLPRWKFYVASYFGGEMYRDGDYLIQHPFESAANYGRRKETAYYYNYCGPIVDIFVSHLFRKDAVRDFGSLADDPLFNLFCDDADLEGNALRNFMREAQRLASVYGRVSILVDKPSITASTRAEAIDNEIRPYLSLITPENLVNWSFKRTPSGRFELASIKIREDEGTYRIFTRDTWEVWQVVEDKAELVDSGEHGLGVVPLVNLYNKRCGLRMVGLSDIQDIADVNKNIYYLCSDAKEIIENTAFPMLATPYTKGGAADETVQAGPKNILQFDPSEPNSKPYWLEAPHSSLSEIREWIRQDIAEIHRIAKMGGVKATEDFTQPRSGVALDLEYQQLYATLSEKADNIEEAEYQVIALWAMWEGKTFDGVIDYPDDFSVRDIDRELNNAIKAQSVRVESSTFKKELQKKVVGMVLPKLDDELKTKIDGEIDSASVSSSTSSEDLINALNGGANG